jgi:hypothetical protein
VIGGNYSYPSAKTLATSQPLFNPLQPDRELLDDQMDDGFSVEDMIPFGVKFVAMRSY